jgi:hypothetical protein
LFGQRKGREMGDGFEENIWANKEISKEIMEKKIKMIIFI